MIKIKFFQFKYQNDSENNKKSPNTHVIIETETGKLYMIDNADQSVILGSDDKGVTWEIIADSLETEPITNLCYDKVNQFIYYSFMDVPGLPGDSIHRIFYVDLSDNSLIQKNNSTLTLGTFVSVVIGDLVLDSNDTPYSFYFITVADGGNHDIFIYHLDGGAPFFPGNTFSTEVESNIAGGDPINDVTISRTTVISDYGYFLYQTTTDHVKLYKVELGVNNWSELYDFGSDSNIPSSVNYQAIAYDDDDKLYFIIYDLGDSKNYLWRYSIGDDIAERLGEFDISIMLDRNNDNSGDTPNNIEKAFAVGGTKIYKFSRTKAGIILIQDIADSPDFTAGSTILAITDNFLFVDNSGTVEIWEQQDVLGDFITFATVDRIIQEFSQAVIVGNIKFTTNQIIELYDNDTEVR